MNIRCGIDLGTTYSAISWYDEDGRRVETVSLDHADGGLILPSVVYFEAGGNVVVGDAADNARTQYPDRVVAGIKRSMGDDYKTAPIDGKEYTPQEVSAEILKALKSDAESYMGEPVKDVVISVPAYFGDRQRQATQEAGALAGLNVLELIPEPHAAALAFAIERVQDVENRNILVYDLGGGTFDITLISTEREELGPDMTGLRITTVGMAGDWHLGGLDWDRALARLVADKAIDRHGIADPHDDAKNEAWLLKTCEQHKRRLSQLASLSIPADMQGHAVDVTRSEFERATAALVMQTEEWTRRVLEEAERDHGLLSERRIQELEAQGTPRAELEPKKVYLLLCGGATRMPMVRDCVTRLMGEPPLQPKNPDLLITIGGAYRAYSLAIAPGSEISVLDAVTERQSIPITDLKSPSPPPPRDLKRVTAVRVIEMFQALNLPVTDDEGLIDAKASELTPRYLRMKGKTDPKDRFKADAWFENLAELQQSRTELHDVVYALFKRLADGALKTWVLSGAVAPPAEMFSSLENLAMYECRCDPSLARVWVERYYLEESKSISGLANGLHNGKAYVRPTNPYRARYSVVDVISMFRELDLPVTDDTEQISTMIKQLSPGYHLLENSEVPQQREKAALWFKTTQRLQSDLSELIEIIRGFLFLFADIELYSVLGPPPRRLIGPFLPNWPRGRNRISSATNLWLGDLCVSISSKEVSR